MCVCVCACEGHEGGRGQEKSDRGENQEVW